ncbi:hypothetical protein [Bacillus badius]|uniref:Membrane protein n=1 Tax=Bacillus badius TaxID=1455 RepID=A0ABR5ARH6_BACBA|nr:hypothetical protein [Bacillus badius]KIL72442.1 membrane protein [Bacillus badius]KIL77337.1 membrane protein [Bacillus badius]MED4718560.1 membrane-spanning protein [Bacillus badius]
MKKKAIWILSILFTLLVVGGSVINYINGASFDWTDMLGRVLTSALPLLLLFCKRIPFSLPLIAGYYLLLFSTFFLGAMLRFYDRFSWWDTATHFLGSAFMAFVAIALYKWYIPESAERHVSSWLIFLFVLSFSITSSVMWEGVEFVGTLIGALESDSNKDTMTDLFSGMAGALIVAGYAVFQKKSIVK